MVYPRAKILLNWILDFGSRLWFNSHSSLSFADSITKGINKLENAMDMRNIFRGFLVDEDIDQKYVTVSLNDV